MNQIRSYFLLALARAIALFTGEKIEHDIVPVETTGAYTRYTLLPKQLVNLLQLGAKNQIADFGFDLEAGMFEVIVANDGYNAAELNAELNSGYLSIVSIRTIGFGQVDVTGNVLAIQSSAAFGLGINALYATGILNGSGIRFRNVLTPDTIATLRVTATVDYERMADADVGGFINLLTLNGQNVLGTMDLDGKNVFVTVDGGIWSSVKNASYAFFAEINKALGVIPMQTVTLTKEIEGAFNVQNAGYNHGFVASVNGMHVILGTDQAGAVQVTKEVELDGTPLSFNLTADGQMSVRENDATMSVMDAAQFAPLFWGLIPTDMDTPRVPASAVNPPKQIATPAS